MTKGSLNDILTHFNNELKAFKAQVYEEGSDKKKWIKLTF